MESSKHVGRYSRGNFLNHLFGLGRGNAAIHARIITNVAAFIAVTCVLTIGPDVLSLTNVPHKNIFVTAILTTVINAFLVTFLSGCPFILTPKVKPGTFLPLPSISK